LPHFEGKTCMSPYVDNEILFITRIRDNILKSLLNYLVSSQIWLIPCVDDHQHTYLKKLKRKRSLLNKRLQPSGWDFFSISGISIIQFLCNHFIRGWLSFVKEKNDLPWATWPNVSSVNDWRTLLVLHGKITQCHGRVMLLANYWCTPKSLSQGIRVIFSIKCATKYFIPLMCSLAKVIFLGTPKWKSQN
jgi:hypothetical protein